MTTIQSVSTENRVFHPSDPFKKAARLGDAEAYERMHRRALEDPEGFWSEQAKMLIPWSKPWERVLEWKEPFAKWFVGGETNACVACVDRHLDSPRKNKAAIVWEGEPGEVRTLTYAQLHREVCKLANTLCALGVSKGDRVAIYMPMVPRRRSPCRVRGIGAPHNVAFGGFWRVAARAHPRCRLPFVITAMAATGGEIVALKRRRRSRDR